MPWTKKISLLIMFSGGFLEMAFGILRCVSVLTVRTHRVDDPNNPSPPPSASSPYYHCVQSTMLASKATEAPSQQR